VRSAREASGRTRHPTSVVGPEVLSDGATEVPPDVVDLAARRRKRA
jgi:hypothetical protein